MKKLLFLLILLCPIVGLAEIDERKIDVYYANGMMASREGAGDSAAMLEEAIKNTIFNGNLPSYNQKIGKVTTAYNTTNDFLSDVLESLLQKIGWVGLTALFNQNYQTDIDKQVDAYKESIASGHKVLAVAHSQGSLFTKDAYASLPSWMRNYVRVVGVAPPTSVVAGGSPIVSWDNDLVGIIGGHGGTKVERSNHTINALI